MAPQDILKLNLFKVFALFFFNQRIRTVGLQTPRRQVVQSVSEIRSGTNVKSQPSQQCPTTLSNFISIGGRVFELVSGNQNVDRIFLFFGCT